MRKALDVLKREKSMGQKYTWKEKEIVKGNRECMIGLLEDMHILFDGLPPRQVVKNNYFEYGPHIGRVFDQLQRQPFYYHKKDDTFELEEDSEDVINKFEENLNPNAPQKPIKDYLGAAKKKYSHNPKPKNQDLAADFQGKLKAQNTETDSNRNLRINTTEMENGSNTDRTLTNKHENVPSIINNQLGSDI